MIIRSKIYLHEGEWNYFEIEILFFTNYWTCCTVIVPVFIIFHLKYKENLFFKNSSPCLELGVQHPWFILRFSLLFPHSPTLATMVVCAIPSGMTSPARAPPTPWGRRVRRLSGVSLGPVLMKHNASWCTKDLNVGTFQLFQSSLEISSKRRFQQHFLKTKYSLLLEFIQRLFLY